MFKLLTIVLVAVLVAGCQQDLFGVVVELHNSCKNPVQLELANFTNGPNEDNRLQVEPNGSARVLAFVAKSHDLGEIVPSNYQLIVKGKSTISVDRTLLLKNAEKNKSKTEGSYYFWSAEFNEACK